MKGLTISNKATVPSTASGTKAGLTVFKNLAVSGPDKVRGYSEEELLDLKMFDEETVMTKINELLSNVADPKVQAVTSLKVAQIVSKFGILSNVGTYIISMMLQYVRGSEKVLNGLIILEELLNKLGKSIENYGVQLFSKIVDLHADKSAVIRDLAASIGKSLVEMVNPYAFQLLWPTLLTGFGTEDWRIKVAALNLLKVLSPRVSTQISPVLPLLIPKVSDCVLDTKKQVSIAGMETLIEACKAITNDDIRPLVPQLVSVIAHPDESIKTLDLLLETTFVATVDAPVLALIAPLLGKSLKNRSSVMKRKASRVIDIMCRLVQDPCDVGPFVPLLLPSLDKCIDELVDAEVCQVAKEAREMLLKAMGEGGVTHAAMAIKITKIAIDIGDTQKKVNADTLKVLGIESVTGSYQEKTLCTYISQICSQLIAYGTSSNPSMPADTPAGDVFKHLLAMSSKSEWKKCTSPYLIPFLKDPPADEDDVKAETDAISLKLRAALLTEAVKDMADEEDLDDGNLCNFEFSLAFGGKILLHNTYLRLSRGRRYGVMGKNGAGKTTLLTNIGSGNIEGLPVELRTVYVQHDDASDDLGISIVDESLAKPELKRVNVVRAQVEEALRKINFTEEMLTSPRSSLSGGWKMKLLIVRAILAKADILLLDEPTNHLDTVSVKWLTDYIMSLHDVTCLIVSHDSAFLDNVLTDVIHYESKKLVYYHGNLTHFVAIHPEAAFYHSLESSGMTFKFPIPERLDGINSTTKAILKCDNISYTYPGASKPQITNCSVKVCLSSRIAVLGANGAGKSTLIKMLVQETEPDENSGEVWKHMNLRIAYVAQHSLHHVDQHLETSPVDYIKWRFHGGVDKEEFQKATTKLTEEEMEEKKHGEKKYGDVDQVLGRRKNGRTMEYECTFIGQNPAREPNKYITVEKMIEMGHSKLVQQCDAKVAAMAAGLDVRPLLTAEIQAHLNDFNLESEFGTHSTIKRLSGGQKVKLVLAAAMWNRPHVIILDEPTNYLDREALGALTQAIKNFAGGIVIISHNNEFTKAICTEEWLVKDGTCFTTGEAAETELKAKSERAIKKSNSNPELKKELNSIDVGANINKSISSEVILNPRTLEGLSKKETRKLEKLAQVAGVTLKEYVSKINCKSPEWKWL